MTIHEQISAYTPVNAQEARDQRLLLSWLESGVDIYTRNDVAHLTASAWVVSPDRQQVLMVYHNIYNSWPSSRMRPASTTASMMDPAESGWML